MPQPVAAAVWGLVLLGVACSAFAPAANPARHHFGRTALAEPARRCAVADAAWRRSTLLRATIEDVATDESARLQRARGRLADAMAGDMFMSPIEKAERGLAPPAPAPAAPPKKAPRFAGPESRTRPQLPPSTTGGRSSVAQPLVGYDPEASAALLWRQPLRWIKRNVEIVLPFVGFATSLLVDVAQSQEEARRAVRAKELLGIISKLGPAIIKGGQALASRPDLLPAEYLVELQKLQDRLPAFSTDVALAQVERELGIDSFEEVYELLDKEPIAAASIGQVYKARLRSNGHIVALKVQRPLCEDIVGLDLYIMRWHAGNIRSVFGLLQRNIDLVSVIDDFGELIYREIDYEAEAANAQRFAELYSNLPDVFVPRVYPALTTHRVLTMEWVDGVRLVDHDELVEKGLRPDRLVDALVQCSLRQMLDNGYFHADPHAGNLLALPDGRLCYLDFGMMSYVESRQRVMIIEGVMHLVNRDFESLAVLYQRMGFIPEDEDTGPIVAALQSALPDVLAAPVSELNFKSVINKLGDVMYTFPFALPPFYISIIRCLGVLEGVAIQVDSEFRIIQDAYPFIASRMLTDDAPELQAALSKLLFKDDRPQWKRFEKLLGKASGAREYDATLAVELLCQLLLADEAAAIRANLVEDVVDALDALGDEAAAAALGALGLPLPPGVPRAAAAAAAAGGGGAEAAHERTPAQNAILKALEAATAAGAGGGVSVDSERLAPLVRRLALEPVFQKAAGDLTTRLTERAVSKTIRAAFGVS